MQVVNGLAAVIPVVDDETVSFPEIQLFRHLNRPLRQEGNQMVAGRDVLDRFDVGFRDDEYMGGGGGMNVVKRQDPVVLINLIGRYLPASDLAENAVVAHTDPPCLNSAPETAWKMDVGIVPISTFPFLNGKSAHKPLPNSLARFLPHLYYTSPAGGLLFKSGKAQMFFSKTLRMVGAGLLGVLLFIPSKAGAGVFTLELMTGTAINFPTPLTVHQEGYPDISLTAQYNTQPFSPYTPYYAWRISLWDRDQAWEFEQVHHRLFLANPPPEIQDFSIHYGYTYFLLGHAWRMGDYILHLGAGAVITSPENVVRGQEFQTYNKGVLDSGYYFSGLGAQAAVSRNFPVWDTVFLLADVGVIGGWAWWVPISNGSADVPTIGIHFHFGTGLGF
jgi:hypothetical protein